MFGLGGRRVTETGHQDTDYQKKRLIKDVMDGNFTLVQNTIDTYPELIMTTDDYSKNTLLHLAVKGKHYRIAEYLIKKSKIDKNKTNVYGETAFDIAMCNRDKKMCNILDELDTCLQYVNETLRLKCKVIDIEKNNQSLMDLNKDITIKRDVAVAQLETEKKAHKRTRDELDTCQREAKRLKTDNDTLQITIKSLSQANRKQ